MILQHVAARQEPQWDMVVVLVCFMALVAFGIWIVHRKEES